MNVVIFTVARTMAWLGGLVLVALTLMSVLSIAGRALSGLGLGPVPGDYELVEAGTALAVLCFLPWCHLRRGHAVVDMFWRLYPPAMQRFLGILTELLMFGVWVLLAWRMGVGTVDYRANGETSFILHMPVWWGYAACTLAAAAGCAVYGWTLLGSLGVQAARQPDGVAGAH